MAFERLPNETLIEIVEYAGVDGRTSSWHSLASTNQKLNRIATPMLYVNFIEAKNTSVPKLLRTVLANPQLATYVRKYNGNATSNEEFLDASALEEVDIAACEAIMQGLRIAPKETGDWMGRINTGNWHALTSLLLLHLPNIEDIELNDYRQDEAADIDRAISARLPMSEAPNQVSTFLLEHLTNVSIWPFTQPDPDDPFFEEDSESVCLYFADILPFLRLKSVKSLAISRLSCDGRAPHLPDASLEFNILELEITDSYLPPRWLFLFLRCFTSLRKFSYEHFSLPGDPDLLPQEMGKALTHLHHCLEELTSNFSLKNGQFLIPEPIGSLAGFERLKSVEMDLYSLYGTRNPIYGEYPVLRLWQILPRKLERLAIVGNIGDTQCHDEYLRE
jgi:hypothetical protein